MAQLAIACLEGGREPGISKKYRQPLESRKAKNVFYLKPPENDKISMLTP
jgi:hypothetical protein